MTSATEFQAKVDKSVVNFGRIDQYVNSTGDVETDVGLVPSFPKLLRQYGDVGVARDQAVAAAAEAQDAITRINDFTKGEPGGNVMAIGTFGAASNLLIPIGTDQVRTSGYALAGRGAAYYAYDNAVNAAYVSANPRSSFLSQNGRGFRLNGATIYPEMLGAVGDGQADDTAPMRAFVRSQAGATCELTAGATYLIDPGTPTTAPGSIILPLARGIKLVGNGATIKVKDGAGGYYALIGWDSGSVDLSGLDISGVRFDHNSKNGTGFVAVSNVLTYHRFTVAARAFPGGASFCDNIVDNASQTNSVYFNAGANGKHIRCSRNKFLNVGDNAGGTVHDYSAWYLVGDDIQANDNHCEGAYWGAPGAVCPGEPHPGDGFEIHRNTWDKMRDGLNITGSFPGGDTKNGNVTGNRGTSSTNGIRLFSLKNGAHTTGYGLDNVNVDDNTVTLLNTLAGGTTGVGGVILQAGSQLDTRNVRMRNNVAIFEIENAAPAYTGVSPAFGAREQSGTVVHEGFVLDGNTAINAPGPGWALGMGGGVFINPAVGVQTLVNCGQGQNAGSAAYRFGGYVVPNEIRGKLRISLQAITDTFATTRLIGGVTFLPTIDSTAADISVETAIFMGGDKVSFVQPVTNSGSKTKPIARGNVNKAWSVSPSHTFRIGSAIEDTTSNITRRVVVEGGAWTREDFGTAPPSSGSWAIGDRRLNTVPAAGGWEGWRCVATGTPGTWKGYGAIST